jgi:membrane associated rhomboid family serine protease
VQISRSPLADATQRRHHGNVDMNGHRDWGGPSEDHQPVTWWKGYPVYAAHFIVLVLVASMIVTSIALFAAWGDTLVNALIFDPELVYRGQLWRLVTFGLVNGPSIPFAFDMVIIVWFGREVERFLGRKKFLTLYAISYLVTPLLLTAIGPWLPITLSGKTGALAVFCAFATLYPTVPVFFSVVAKWAALILVGLYTLMGLAYRSPDLLIPVWASCGAAYLYVRHAQGLLELPRLRLWRRKPRLRVLPDLPKPKPISAPKESRDSANMAEIDALLDKIAQSGIGSLTPKERAKLDAAREGLLKRGADRG